MGNIKDLDLNVKYGYVVEIHETFLVVEDLLAPLNSIVSITSKYNEEDIKGIVTKISQKETVVSLFSKPTNLILNDKVLLETKGIKIPQPEDLIGKVINSFGDTIFEESNLIQNYDLSFSERNKFDNLKVSNEQFLTGIKVIDTILPIVKGQRVSINAGTGVGKTTLLSNLIKNSNSEIKIIALIGERKREVLEFIEKDLNNDLTNTIIVVSTSDDVPLMRKYASYTATKLAEHFGQTKDVLLLMDSLTRAAIAQREISFNNGELPVLGGFPQSSFSFIPELLEKVGCKKEGSVTAFFTVLVDNENEEDVIGETPLANYIRGISDGHILLDRNIAIKGIYPSIDLLISLSRMSGNIKDFDEQWLNNINKIKKVLSTIKESQLLIDLGTYQKGMNPLLDYSLENLHFIEEFVSQKSNESYGKFKELQKEFKLLANKF